MRLSLVEGDDGIQILSDLTRLSLNWHVDNLLMSTGAHSAVVCLPCNMSAGDQLMFLRIDFSSPLPSIILHQSDWDIRQTIPIYSIRKIIEQYDHEAISYTIEFDQGSKVLISISDPYSQLVFRDLLLETVAQRPTDDWSPELFSSILGTVCAQGVLCIHKGVIVTLDTTEEPRKQFAILVKGMFLVFKKMKDIQPRLVISMNKAKFAAVPSSEDESQCSLEISCPVSSSTHMSNLVIRVASTASRNRWLSAFAVEAELRQADIKAAIKQSITYTPNLLSRRLNLADNPRITIEDISSPTMFFRFVRRELVHRDILSRTLLNGSEVMHHRSLKAVGKSLEDYSNLAGRCRDLIRRALIASLPINPQSGHTNHSQINFSFPGFEEQLFTIGVCSVVSLWRCLAISGRFMCLSDGDWDGALNSPNIGQELMQCMVDVLPIYDIGQGNDAKCIGAESTFGLLLCLSIAAFLNRPDVLPACACSFSQIISPTVGKSNYDQLMDHFRSEIFYFHPDPRRILSELELTDSDRRSVFICTPHEVLRLIQLTLLQRRTSVEQLRVSVQQSLKSNNDSARSAVLNRLYHDIVQESCELNDALFILPELSALQTYLADGLPKTLSQFRSNPRT